ncbi:bacitracin ABC transporter permease [Anaerotruncus sp. 1XD22-93]|nr:bacitracin ABC transporter permease [Lachnospiraceae bacterium]NBI76538.1 bacitracin ABC transporter permease [Lachnospiraceae bacterium]RKJ79402.1 bacitracin ABC transporter permease [Anaerotruncus sp. 1XD22-93]
MWNLIRMEIKKVPLKPHIAGLLIANFIIFLLSVFTSSLLTASGNISTLPGFAPVQLDTVTLAAMLVRATLIVWEAVLISVFVIEEYRNKTICLLFTYPISRTKLITAKLILICGIMFLFHVLSNIFQYATIFLAAKCFDFVTFSFGNIMAQAVTTISAILLGLLPLYVGMIKKSAIATVVSSIIIVAIASNSQGSSAGLLSIPIAAIIFGIIGITFSAITMRKMILSDLSS